MPTGNVIARGAVAHQADALRSTHQRDRRNAGMRATLGAAGDMQPDPPRWQVQLPSEPSSHRTRGDLGGAAGWGASAGRDPPPHIRRIGDEAEGVGGGA
jgi:hypothetical protein